jgi:hypothetical protein
MGGLPDSGVVHVQIGADRPHDHAARVQTDADADREAVLPADPLGVSPHRLLHAQRRIAGPDRVILVRHRRAEERHDPIAHHLVDRPLVTVDGLNHAFEHRVEELPGLFGVAVGEQLHRALQVCEEHRHLLALAFEGGLRGEDLLGEVLGGIGLRGCEPCRLGSVAVGRLPAF